MALYQRQMTGRGAYVGTSLLANGIWSNGVMAQAALCGARFVDRPPREQALNAFTNYYRCRDGRWLILTILNEDRHWPVMAKCTSRQDLLTDSRFVTSRDRLARAVELIAIFDEASQPRIVRNGAGFWATNGIVFDVVAIAQDIPTDEQLIANDILVPFDGETALTVTSPIFMEGQEKVKPRRAPTVGQHTDEILREAGYDEESIKTLRQDGAIA